MSRRIDRVNKYIQRAFGEILQTETDVPVGVLVTISSVETVPNLRSTTIWLSVFPDDRAQEVMAHLKANMYDLQGALNRKLTFHPLPRIDLRLDHGAQHAEDIERQLKKLG